MKKWKYYLFDLDGTLVNTQELIYRCFSKVLNHFMDQSISRHEVYSLIGLPYREQLECYTGKLSDDLYSEIVNYHKVYQNSIYSDLIKPCAGAIETIEGLFSRGQPMAIVTSRHSSSASDYLKQLGLLDYFSHIIDPTLTQIHKPNPEPVLKALELLNAEIKDSVFIGDSIFDIQSGNQAGVDTVYTSYGHADFTKGEIKPDFIIDDLTELLN